MLTGPGSQPRSAGCSRWRDANWPVLAPLVISGRKEIAENYLLRGGVPKRMAIAAFCWKTTSCPREMTFVYTDQPKP